MNPDDIVLVALINSPRDLEIVHRERWYRIPARAAPKYFTGAQYLAFYLTRAFGEHKWTIHEYASVRGHELARRRDLLPHEPAHPRADEHYYKLQLGPLQAREPPIVSKRGRRLLFIWTRWDKFANAREINDLLGKSAAEDKLWSALKDDQLDAERELFVRDGRTRYRVDFLVYCPRGQLAIRIGSPAHRAQPRPGLRTLAISDDELENHFERALNEIRTSARELGAAYARQETIHT